VTEVRATFVEAAWFAARLLADPGVEAHWDDPSALAEMCVGALAGHLARQVLLVQRQLTVAADGPAALAARTAAAAGWLEKRLPAEPAGRSVFLPWGPWALTLDDMLRTRIMEIAVHGDDLSCSVDLREPGMPFAVAATAIELLTRLAVRRHGTAAVLRALSRAERALSSIAAF
jgi:hypothetical protein